MKPILMEKMKKLNAGRHVVPVLIVILLTAKSLYGQHQHQMPARTDTTQSADHHADHHERMGHEQMQHDTAMSSVPMSHAYSLNLPMNRNGSGTGWLPDASPMYGYMVHSGKWMYMLHGNLFIRYDHQDIGDKGLRGDSKIDAPNWFMAMGQRKAGQKGLFHFSAMFSLDPLFGNEGYPLLFQTGETYRGKPLVDRQHPHNLFSELSIAYTQSFTKDLDAFVYLGYPGEPALGPVTFMHRPSSLNNPDSPLGHHWQDATHITFGVATVGFRYKIMKVDGSLFTGREPGEARYGFDKPRFDSYSYRLTINPSRSLSAQLSKAFLKSPEAIRPDEDVNRTTASLIHAMALDKDNSFLTSALIWGYNDSGDNHREHSLTLESNLQLDRFAAYGRFENIEKSAGELLISDYDEHELFTINALTLGINYTFLRQCNTNFALGAQGTLYSADKRLDPVYGNNPKALEVYLRISPAIMKMKM
ncbi:MAG TPA: hypothetical protein VF490_17470 [Chryseosolibacter sp.]